MSALGVQDTKALPKRTRGFRAEVEGLRALAIGLVLVYHAGVPFADGGYVGVDIFFVISGYLITSHILREIDTTGKLSLAAFWARRMKRLLPAAVTVLTVTTIAAWILLPSTSWRSIGSDISAAALYVVNWRFAAEAVDYGAEGSSVSPVLHFWSLAVEEQFYVVWPLAIALTIAVAVRFLPRVSKRTALLVVIVVICVVSFVWSMRETSQSPDTAFFATTTRIWELGIGALVAMGAIQWPRISTQVARCIGWAGLLAVLAAAALFSREIPWPGSAALLPVLGTAALILATTGRDISRGTPAQFLAWRPIVWVGGLSYSWYLWHWPVLTIAEAHFGELRLRYKLVLVLASGVLAWLSLKFIENPVRRSSRLRDTTPLTLSFGLNLTLVGVLAGALLLSLIPQQSAAVSEDDLAQLGAAQLQLDDSGLVASYDAPTKVSATIPAPAAATEDLPQAERDGCVAGMRSAELTVCDYGDPEGELEVALVGDSKMLQWQPAIATIAEHRGWRVTTYLKSACAFADPSYSTDNEQRESCAQWNHAALAALQRAKPDIVLTSGRQVFEGTTSDGDVTPGVERVATSWVALQDAGITVVPLLDNPAPEIEVYECVAQHMSDISQCGFDRDEGVARSGARYQVPAAKLAGIDRLIDVSDIACAGSERCPSVIGDVLVYRQGSHLTNTFVASAVRVLEPRLVRAVEGG
ncbi:acyltransferase family protein [Leucobacter sp. NPDC058333]|uniref:acyltransferase family protein n=1 Tax=Leucobacter sp. NPDC058333 TaxID=3346450 RepID=UPI00364834B2